MKKNTILVIGMGKFGCHFVNKLLQYGNEIMIIDRDESKLSDMLGKVTQIQVGDCTDEAVIDSLGVGNFDIVVVCIDTDFESSLIVTSMLKEKGAKHIATMANRDIHARLLLKNGADEIIYPERDTAAQKARSYSADNVYDYIELDDGFSIYEIAMPEDWVGHSLKELNIRQRFHINIIGLKQNDRMNILPDVDYKFIRSDRLLVVGEEKTVDRLLHIQGEKTEEDKFWKKGRKNI